MKHNSYKEVLWVKLEPLVVNAVQFITLKRSFRYFETVKMFKFLISMNSILWFCWFSHFMNEETIKKTKFSSHNRNAFEIYFCNLEPEDGDSVVTFLSEYWHFYGWFYVNIHVVMLSDSIRIRNGFVSNVIDDVCLINMWNSWSEI